MLTACTEIRTLVHVGGNVKCAATLETVWWFLKESKLLHDPAIPLQDTHSRALKTYVYTKPYTSMSIAALFIAAQKWKQPHVHQLMNNHTMEYYLAIQMKPVTRPHSI